MSKGVNVNIVFVLWREPGAPCSLTGYEPFVDYLHREPQFPYIPFPNRALVFNI